MEFAGKTNESHCANFASYKAASWPILHGSLNDTVNCESSLSPVDSDANSASPKSAVVLRRPSLDCGPCEIKITFEQKHEIRQVYVRSSARVYEIYYAADRQSMNEYLCTVRCGIAARTEGCLEDESLQDMGAATSVSPGSTGSNELSEGLKTDSGGNTNEDGWVEIKDPDSSLTKDGDSSSLDKTAVPVERENQDFYEATAEISDANPCTSITIRLLSLQSAESAYIDEIYVFADPIESDDVNSAPKEVGNSAGNPLMSMLIPTLLQLSKSRTNQLSDLTPNSKKSESSSGSTSTVAKIQKEEIPSVCIEQGTVTSKLDCPDESRSLKAPTENLNDHIGKTLDLIVARIVRIEQFCLSFEQKMINPINSIDTRLGEVEQQLKLLNKKFQLPEMHSATKNHAPDVPHNDSEFSSSHTDDASVAPFVITAPEFSNSSLSLENDGGCTEEVENCVPGLVVTAPEFSYGEEEEEELTCDNLKKPVSIDDALADALAGFVSSAVKQDSTVTLDDDDSEKDGEKIIASEHVKSDELDADVETSVDIVAESGEDDAFLFSKSEPTVEIIAGHDHTSEEENAQIPFLHGLTNDFIQAEEMGIFTKEDDILDVKFESRESVNLNSCIEALLTETTETDIGNSFAQEITGEDYSIEPDSSEVIVLEASNHLWVDLGQDDSVDKSHYNSNEEVSVLLF